MSLLERLAHAAYDAEEATLEEGMPLARDLIRASPLATWFAPVTWAIVDHNLPCDPYEVAAMVVVTSDEDEPPSVPLRIVVCRVGIDPAAQWTVWMADPRNSGPNWLDGASPVTRASDISTWIKTQRPTG